MTKQDAIKSVVAALATEQGFRPENEQSNPAFNGRARDIVVALAALGLLKLT